MRVWLSFLFALLSAVAAALLAPTGDLPASGADSMQRKLQHIQANGTLPQPDQTSTEFTEQEVNAYFASGAIKLPAGVQAVTFQGQPGVVTGTAKVDFDRLKAGRSSYNPLLSIFTGIHNVVIVAHAHGAGGQGSVNVDSVALDGVEIPRFVLQLFAEKYLQPKYSNIGLDSRFALPNRVDTATVGLHRLTVTQK